MTASLVAIEARAFAQRRAIRQSGALHRRLDERPIAIVLFQMAGEPFGATAICYGRSHADPGLVVCPDPRNRDLLFTALQPFAEWFCAAFEEPNAYREADPSGEIATAAPQIVVANRATAGALANLARRTAYLESSGEYAADPALIQMGRHLQWATGHVLPGQQVLVALTDLVGDNWATALSDLESQSLAALDAFIEPPPGLDGLEAAWAAEELQMGTLASAESDRQLAELVEPFNAARRDSDGTAERRLSGEIRDHLVALVEPAWEVLWRALERERTFPEAPSVERRLREDRYAYTRHMDWQAEGGRRRTSETTRQAAWLRQQFEDARQRLEAEEAIDDPLRMVAAVVDGRAIVGTVTSIDLDHREQGPTRMVRRPRVEIECDQPAVVPVGTEMRWTKAAGTTAWTVDRVQSRARGGSLVTLKRGSGIAPRRAEVPFLPDVGDEVIFSEHSLGGGPPFMLPREEPWTHRPRTPDEGPGPIESEE